VPNITVKKVVSKMVAKCETKSCLPSRVCSHTLELARSAKTLCVACFWSSCKQDLGSSAYYVTGKCSFEGPGSPALSSNCSFQAVVAEIFEVLARVFVGSVGISATERLKCSSLARAARLVTFGTNFTLFYISRDSFDRDCSFERPNQTFGRTGKPS
jgi:hypothetical protein